jgi:hypothetical protein
MAANVPSAPHSQQRTKAQRTEPQPSLSSFPLLTGVTAVYRERPCVWGIPHIASLLGVFAATSSGWSLVNTCARDFSPRLAQHVCQKQEQDDGKSINRFYRD